MIYLGHSTIVSNICQYRTAEIEVDDGYVGHGVSEPVAHLDHVPAWLLSCNLREKFPFSTVEKLVADLVK